MGLFGAYRQRLRRRRSNLRARYRGRELTPIANRTKLIVPGDILLFSTIRNENLRLPWFLHYYREMGVAHFIIVDNGSNDGGREYLAEQPDVSLWTTSSSYRDAHFGIDWLNRLQGRYGHGHWCLTVDPDEFFIYPFCDTRPLTALTDWLDDAAIRSFGAMLLDMYPKGKIGDAIYERGTDPLKVAAWFDPGNYAISRNPLLGNLWIQGGPRARQFFPDMPHRAPALNKMPLVKWQRGYAYVSSTHMLLPRGLNLAYDEWGGEKASGVLLHAKFLSSLSVKTEEEAARRQHYADGREYRAYAAGEDIELWSKWSEKYLNWRQLEVLGLMSKGNWA